MTKLQARKFIAPRREEKYLLVSPDLGVPCVFARVIFFPFGNSKTTPISNMLG